METQKSMYDLIKHIVTQKHEINDEWKNSIGDKYMSFSIGYSKECSVSVSSFGYVAFVCFNTIVNDTKMVYYGMDAKKFKDKLEEVEQDG